MNAAPKCPAPSELSDMAWEIKALLDALDELMPLDTFDGVSLHALAQIGSTRARALANHLSVIVEVSHV